VNATERSALVQGALFYDQIASAMDDRTLEILERRRSTSTVHRRGWLVRRMLLAADLLGLTVAFIAAQLLLGPNPNAPNPVDATMEWVLFFGTLPAWIVVAKLYGLYERDEERTDHSTVDDMRDVFHMVTVGAWVLVVTAWLTGLARPDIVKLALFWAFAIALITLGRAAARTFCRTRITYLQNAVIVGAGEVGQLIGRKLLQHPEYGINLVGFVDAEPKERRPDLEHLTLLGPPERLATIIRLFDVERVLIAFSNESHDATLRLIRSLKDLDVQIDIVPRLFDIVGTEIGIHTVEGLPLLGLRPLRLSASSQMLKRGMDLGLAGLGLLCLAPAFALIALAIKFESTGPVFFRQERMGTGGRTFRIFKFRTMTADAEERKSEVAHLNKHATSGGDPRMFKIAADPRVTRVGQFLRRFDLDELPQLINVVRGEMSLVGPRPLILVEDVHVQDWARNRLNLRPGMTGVWQVLGRSEIPFEEMTKLDYLYVTNWSLVSDLKLIGRTIPAVLKRRAAY
jgi:exopolysaccharide biosynthesis polyprenyl glycosylphosphotransferase